MEIKIFATTKINYTAPQDDFNRIGGICAGVCYLPHDIDTLINEDIEKTNKRIVRTLSSGHHSPYDHPYITLELIDIPKIVAMLINNEKMYTTSEKSARYKKMTLPENEKTLYDKWLNIFEEQIRVKYQNACPVFFTDLKIKKLAQENARYLTSVFTPTSMIYSLSYRQFNNIIAFIEKEISILEKQDNLFSKKLSESLRDFYTELKKLPYYNENLAKNEKNRSFSLIKRTTNKIQEYFGDVYATTYKGSFAELAQAQRHRTIIYNMEILNQAEYYVPPIIEENEKLKEEWIKDCNSLNDIFPQGLLVNINEMGTIDNFLLKAKERECTMAQLEICNQTTLTKEKMYKALQNSQHPRAEELKSYMNGSRCTFPDYTCSFPCQFKDGIIGTRKI